MGREILVRKWNEITLWAVLSGLDSGFWMLDAGFWLYMLDHHRDVYI